MALIDRVDDRLLDMDRDHVPAVVGELGGQRQPHLAGPDDRAPLSYEVDTSRFTRAVKSPSIKGWRVAWTPDLDGLIPVDEEMARINIEASAALAE